MNFKEFIICNLLLAFHFHLRLIKQKPKYQENAFIVKITH